MKHQWNILVGASLLLALTGCNKRLAESEPPPEPVATPAPIVAAAIPTPAPAITTAPTRAVAATPTPAAAHVAQLAPPGVFYLLEAARIEMESGLVGLPPGTGVKLLHDDVYLTPAGEAHLRADQLTNDMALARKARDVDRAAQNAAQARIAADSKAIAERARAETMATPQPIVAAASIPAPNPMPTTPALGSSLARPQDALNTTHTSTKDKVYVDQLGHKYWKDAQGKTRYDF